MELRCFEDFFFYWNNIDINCIFGGLNEAFTSFVCCIIDHIENQLKY